MSYLVKFSDAHGKTRQETFETEQQVLECKDKDSIISIQKIDEELTLEQLQEQVYNKTPQELQEADFMDKHIKVGDIIYFENQFWDERDCEHYYDFFYARVVKIIKHFGIVYPTLDLIAYNGGALISEEAKTKIGKLVIHRVFWVCTEKYFDKEILRAEQEKQTKILVLKREIKETEEIYNNEIERLKVLKGML